MMHERCRVLARIRLETGMDSKKLEEAVYAACLAAAISLGSQTKDLSWFGANQPSPSKLAAAA